MITKAINLCSFNETLLLLGFFEQQFLLINYLTYEKETLP